MIRKPSKLPANRSLGSLYARLHGPQVSTQAEPLETRQNADLTDYGQQDTFDAEYTDAAQLAAYRQMKEQK